MTAPRTRIAEGVTEFERDLLRSWEREQPSDAARQRALALVGGAAALGASTTASTAGAAGLKGAAGAAGSMAPKAATLGLAAFAKWAIVGASLVALAVAGVAVEHARSSSEKTPATASAAAPVAGSGATLPPSSQASTLAPSGTTTTEASAAPTEGRPTASSPTASAAPEPRPPAVGLGQQVAALDRARDALASGNATGAIRLVDEYDGRFPRGALAQEATALRIEALLHQGDRDAAVHLADRFLASNPRSPHAARIRLLVQRAYNP